MITIKFIDSDGIRQGEIASVEIYEDDRLVTSVQATVMLPDTDPPIRFNRTVDFMNVDKVQNLKIEMVRS